MVRFVKRLVNNLTALGKALDEVRGPASRPARRPLCCLRSGLLVSVRRVVPRQAGGLTR